MADAERGEDPPWTDRLHGFLPRAMRALLGQSGIRRVLTTNLVATCRRTRQLAVLRAMRRYWFVLSDVQRFLDYWRERQEEPEALALFAEAGLRDPELFLDLGAGGRYYLFTDPARRGLGLASAVRRCWPA